MSCCGDNGSGGRITKKRIMVFASLGAGIAAASYFALTTSNSQALLASSALLGFAACPAMCAVMGGGIWIYSKFSSKKKNIHRHENENNESSNQKEDTMEHSCCSAHGTNENHEEEELKNPEIASTRLKKKTKTKVKNS